MIHGVLHWLFFSSNTSDLLSFSLATYYTPSLTRSEKNPKFWLFCFLYSKSNRNCTDSSFLLMFLLMGDCPEYFSWIQRRSFLFPMKSHLRYPPWGEMSHRNTSLVQLLLCGCSMQWRKALHEFGEGSGDLVCVRVEYALAAMKVWDQHTGLYQVGWRQSHGAALDVVTRGSWEESSCSGRDDRREQVLIDTKSFFSAILVFRCLSIREFRNSGW